MAGYKGYSMSNNAVSAYESGEKPLSKWGRDDILDAVKSINPDKYELIKGLPTNTLKQTLLRGSSWHHTGKMYNKTDFYSVDEDALDEITPEKAKLWSVKEPKEEKVAPVVKKGSVDYLTWEGTRAHPKPVKHRLDDVNIEQRGSFYIVTDDKGKEVLRKKVDSNGTKVYYKNPNTYKNIQNVLKNDYKIAEALPQSKPGASGQSNQPNPPIKPEVNQPSKTIPELLKKDFAV